MVKNRRFQFTPHVFGAPLGVTPSEFRRDLWHQKKLESVGYCAALFSDSSMFSPFERTSTFDGRTDKQIYRQTHDFCIYRVA